MESSNHPFIVLGEASESDDDNGDEDHFQPFSQPVGRQIEQVEPIEVIAVGEAPESDIESEDYVTSAFQAKRDEVLSAENSKYNSLLHKKLRESNIRLKGDLTGKVVSTLRQASSRIESTNERLLESQVRAQESAQFLRKSTNSLMKTECVLGSLLSRPFLNNFTFPPQTNSVQP